ncbi:MAG: VWA domain-containing protein [Anaerolineae bacterium]|nr:VWA domain-containing protein [Anaerolineae bacterium]
MIRHSRGSRSFRVAFLGGLLALGILLIACCAVTLSLSRSISKVTSTSSSSAPTMPTDPHSAMLAVAVSPEKQALLQELAGRFNDRRLHTPDGKVMTVEIRAMDSQTMLDLALRQALAEGNEPAPIQALNPDSSLWLGQLDRTYAEQVGAGETIAPRIIADTVRYAVSPIVIAAWEPVARDLGWPDRPVGWRDIQRKARADPGFKWNHASTSHASGLLATLAEFYAGAGKVRDLTVEDVQAQQTLDYVAAIEHTVRYYGESETAILERARAEGRQFLDAFVVQEQMVVQFNREHPPERLIAIYPVEGTLWADHPLALLEQPGPTANQRRTFQAFREFLLSPEVQRQVLAAGYRPADLSIPLDGKGSPLTAANGVDPTQPQTTLQIPGPAVVSVVQDVWWYTKRHTNVFLVVDASGSMRGEKLEAVQQALHVFLDQIKGDRERVGLIVFSHQVTYIEPLAELGENRIQLEQAIDRVQAGGNTALLDAVRTAYARLRRLGEADRINAIVVMTDGKENASGVSLQALVEEIQQGNQAGPPVVIFAIAYGRDADYDVLRALAEASGGQVRQGDLDTIRQLYKVLSSYF